MLAFAKILSLLKKNGTILFGVSASVAFLMAFSSAAFSQEDEEDYYDDEYIEDSYVDESQAGALTDGFFTPVKDFDISGFHIGMDYKSVIKIAKEMKYTVEKLVSDTPEYLKYNFDMICQQQKIFQVDALAACVEGYAKKAKMNYTKEVRLKKASTGEMINLFLTSPLTDNMVYRIEYKIDLMSLQGDQKKFLYAREENRRAFWYTVIEKYGQPNVEPNVWIYNPDDEFSTTMFANFEGILLENRGMSEIDFIEGVKRARTTFKPTEFSF